jgi:hypothetical protein
MGESMFLARVSLLEGRGTSRRVPDSQSYSGAA